MEEDARSKFMAKLNALYSKKPNNTYLITMQEYVHKLQRLTDLGDLQVQRTAADNKLVKNYCVAKDSNNQLKLCKPGTNLLYVEMEELYDVLHGIHLQLNHAGRNCMQRHIRTHYCNISKDCVMLYLQTCHSCPRTKRMNGVTKRHAQSNAVDESDDEIVDIVGAPNSMIEGKKDHNSTASANVLSATPLTFTNQKSKRETENFNRGQVDLFDMSKNPDDKYSWFLRYTNCTTRQISLRPITTGTVPEIANELLNIYCDQGAPVILQSLNGRPFVQQVIVETNKLYPHCRQLHSEMQDVGNVEPEMILNQLYALMKRFNTTSWSSILRILQFEINSTYRSDINNNPFQMAYGRQASMGLRNSKLMDILYERSNSIDDFMEYLADAELMRMSVFCQQTENKPNPLVRQCDEFGFTSNNYSPISTNGIATTSTMSSQIVCTPESLPHSSTSSNNSFYAQPTPHTPTLPQGNTYHSLANAQPQTPTQNSQQNSHFPVNTFEQSPATHSPNAYFPSVTSAQIVNNNEAMSNTIKDDDSMMPSQMDDLQPMNC